MNIEITTTKKKLTKSLINQMRPANVDAMNNGVVHGYLINVVKDSYKTYLIERLGEYYLLSDSWKKGKKSVYRKIGKWSTSLDFELEEQCDYWWEGFEKVKRNGKSQIYI